MGGESSEVRKIREELTRVRRKIASLQELESSLTSQLESILVGLEDEIDVWIDDQPEGSRTSKSHPLSSSTLIDYTSEFKPSTSGEEKLPWPWTDALHDTLKKVWGINKFRLNQQAVCNAVLANRDVLVIMPTGGGKSLTYQLPALLSNGTTLVISPLVALMADQYMHLQNVGVPAELLNASTTRQEASLIMKRLVHATCEQTGQSTQSKGKRSVSQNDLEPIKLCYVTPEKIAKSKTFVATLQKMYESKRLKRIIIDEAHCCSSMGHDFRPDYKQLAILKTLFPDTPIVALTATCPPHVMTDVLKILKLGPITNSNRAGPKGTVLFTSSLNRPNLHYQVLKKPTSNTDLIDQIVRWIDNHHTGSQGIVYTLSQKDTSTVAQGILAQSKGRITTGIYHASLFDAQKHQVHAAWRQGSIQVVCATTAFGMGIDAPHVRFVIHHTLPKSTEGYYQESGRAGRDGLVSDCLLFWKTSDIIRLSGMVASETDGITKLYSVAKYAVEVERCRSTLFADYFNTSRSTRGSDDPLPFSPESCQNCDNCKRDPSQIVYDDFTVQACHICHVVGYITGLNGRITMIQLGDLMRGVGPSIVQIIKNRQVDQDLDDSQPRLAHEVVGLEKLIGNKLVLTKEQLENLILHLILRGYLAEQFVATAYTVNSYIKLGSKFRDLALYRDTIITVYEPSSSEGQIPNHAKIIIPSVSASTSSKQASDSHPTPKNKKNAQKKPRTADNNVRLANKKKPVSIAKAQSCDNVVISDDDDDDDSNDDQVGSSRAGVRENHQGRGGRKRKACLIEIDSEEDD